MFVCWVRCGARGFRYWITQHDNRLESIGHHHFLEILFLERWHWICKCLIQGCKHIIHNKWNIKTSYPIDRDVIVSNRNESSSPIFVLLDWRRSKFKKISKLKLNTKKSDHPITFTGDDAKNFKIRHFLF